MATQFDELRHVHVIGVGGTLMGAFAALLRRRGVRVTGSDGPIYPPMSDVLRQAGVEALEGYRAANLERVGRPDLVVIGNVISAGNEEARAVIDGGLPYASLPEAMERFLLPKTRNLVVAGTHGKTTTSSLLAFTLDRLGARPSYFIGGVTHDLPHSFHVTEGAAAGAPFVLEGDEYDTAFWDKVPKFNHYLPDDVILTSVEYDHADIYPDLDAVIRAFEGLVDRIRPGGRLFACVDYAPVRALVARARSRGIDTVTYAVGSGPGVDVHLARLATAPSGGVRFAPDGPAIGAVTPTIELQLPGQHNALNALAAFLLLRAHGHDAAAIGAAMAAFRGVKRRQELRGEPGGVAVVDDFAHHPTAVRETLAALRGRFPGRRLIAVFEPRSATSRRKVFQKDYGEAFRLADSVLIAQAYDQSKIASDDQFSSAQLVEDLRRRGQAAGLFTEVDEGVALAAGQARAGDVVAVLSNGGFGGFIAKLLTVLGSR